MADESKSTGHMERTLQTRHLSMIALVEQSVRTFIASGSAISTVDLVER